MHNAAGTLERLLESLSRQGLAKEEMEAIIVDDGSTDGSAELVENLKAKHPFIQLHRGKNLGAGGGRNIGIRAARGEYLWFVDADDYLADGAAKILIRHMCDGLLDLLSFNFINDYGDRLSPSTDFFNKHLAPSHVMNGLEYIAAYNHENTVTNLLMRTAVVRKEDLFFLEQVSHEDINYIYQLLIKTQRIAHYPSAAYAYVRRPGSVSAPRTEAQVQKYIKGAVIASDSLLELESHLLKTGAPCVVIQKLSLIRETTIFFAIMKMRLRKSKFVDLIKFHNQLVKKSHLPLRQFGVVDYQSPKWKFLKMLFQTPWTFALFIKTAHEIEMCRKLIKRNTQSL